LKKVIHAGHSAGAGEIARYIGRHGTKRMAKAVLIGSVPPLMLKTETNPAGVRRSAERRAERSFAVMEGLEHTVLWL
jgi:pimeloyl-ACP methyl ester carboxylesterase